MNLQLRLETPADYRAVEELTREAFWGFFAPVCDEHYLVHTLRGRPSFVPELDFVAELDGCLVGNIMYSKAKIVSENGRETDVLTFGPLSVLPAYWHKGVGTALMHHTIGEAIRLGYRAIVFYGHPDYYPRFSFRRAAAFGVTTPDGKTFDALMAMPLYDGALDGVSGTFHEDDAFAIDAKAAEQFNLTFPPKEPTIMVPIGVLLDRLDAAARKAYTGRSVKTLAKLQEYSGREMLEWDGVNEQTMDVINRTLAEHGYAQKLLPNSRILQTPTPTV